MKPQHLLIWFVVLTSSIAGGTLALLSHDRLKLPFDLPAVEGQKATQPTSSVQDQTSQHSSSPSAANPSAPSPSANQYEPVAPGETAAAPVAPRQPIVLRDEVAPGSAFDQFRSQFRQAVRNRNAAFVKGLFPAEGVSIGFGSPRSPEEYRLDDPNSRFWGVLEQSLRQGCTTGRPSDYPNVDRNSQVWICPNVNTAFEQQYPNPGTEPGIGYEISRVIVVGNRVNVRAQAAVNSAIVGSLSNEVVEFDRQAFEDFPADQREAKLLHPVNGWTPVILANGQRGFVYNRYAYRPLGERLILGQIDGAWKIIYIPAGD
ncbi:SH3 domain-containing protein [Leptolyngbya ohadii]|uniref:SH3 domain-containing protein n=1 Tax=Leptolyngbya ohadii TaxID=1962290 RepID=UPI000B59C8F9|nr:SH3 domain-containing protein [Leptolyngbya ohadii]